MSDWRRNAELKSGCGESIQHKRECRHRPQAGRW